MWIKFLTILSVLVSGSAYASAQCRALKEAGGHKFLCSDGSIQKVSLLGGQIVIKTYNPETKSWSESRFPASEGISLDTVNISVRQGG